MIHVFLRRVSINHPPCALGIMSVLPVPRIARPQVDLRMAESYIPGALLWFKCIAYTCVIPAYIYGGGGRIPLTGTFLVALYYDHLYLNPYALIDTTPICVDVTCAALLQLSVIDPREYRMAYLAPLVVWVLAGCTHMLVQMPNVVAHMLSFSIIVTVLAFSQSPTSLGEHTGIPESEGVHQVDLIIAFTHTLVYTVLVLVDIYLLRGTQKDADRIYTLRYASTLVSPWPFGCLFAAILFAAQCLSIYKQQDSKTPATSPRSYHHPQLITPAQLRVSTTVAIPSTAAGAAVGVASLDIRDAFRLAQQQHASTNVAHKMA